MESSLKIEQKHLKHTTYMTLATATAGKKTVQYSLQTLPDGRVHVRPGYYSAQRSPAGKKTGGGSFLSSYTTTCENLQIAKAHCREGVEK